MNSKKYIPVNDIKFLVWIKKLLAYVALHLERWYITAPLDELNELAAIYEHALDKTQSANRGSVDVHDKNVARQRLEKTTRMYVQGFLTRNPYVTNSDRKEMGLPVYDTTPTPVSKPTVRAMGKIVYKGAGSLELHITPEADISDNKRAYYGCKIVYDVIDANIPPPQSEKGLGQAVFTRRKKEPFIFHPQDAAKRVYFCIRYENGKGEAGPWSHVFSAVIP